MRADHELVLAVHTRWWDALLASEASVLDTLLADDLTFHSPYGTTSTKAEFLANVSSARLKYDSIVPEAPLARLRGVVAIVTGGVEIAFKWEARPGRERLYYTAVYELAVDQWRMLAWQSTMRNP